MVVPSPFQNGFYAGALVLLSHGANVHVVNHRSDTAADVAAHSNDLEMRALLEAAAREPGGFTHGEVQGRNKPLGALP